MTTKATFSETLVRMIRIRIEFKGSVALDPALCKVCKATKWGIKVMIEKLLMIPTIDTLVQISIEGP